MTVKTEKPKAVTKKKKDFDAVAMMRKIRDKISKDIKGMSFEEEQEYIRNAISKGK